MVTYITGKVISPSLPLFCFFCILRKWEIQIDELILIYDSFFDNYLRRFKDVFVFVPSDSRFGTNVTLNKTLSTPEERTRVVGNVIKCLAEEEKELIPGIRNEV